MTTLLYPHSSPPIIHRDNDIQTPISQDSSNDTLTTPSPYSSEGEMAMKATDTSPSSSTHPSAAASASAQRQHPPPIYHSYSDSAATGHHPSTLAPPLATQRRQSRFDPMGHDDESGEMYEDLGHRHPLRRVKEEERGHDQFTLPSLKSLFGPADHPPTPASSTYPYQSPLSALSAISPSVSPSSSRTSRYSSFTSSVDAQFQSSGATPGWWAPDERPNMHPVPSRSRSYPAAIFSDEPDAKRRRSDLPISPQDPEEVARLKWQSQNRNASYPMSGSFSAGPILRPPFHPPHHAHLHPPSQAQNRGSISGSSGMFSPPTEHGGAYAFNRRESNSTSSRNTSFSGPLSRSFADLSASERNNGMLPPSLVPPERRSSAVPFQPEDTKLAVSGSRDSSCTPTTTPQPPDRSALASRPPSPGPSETPRRSSLTEQIKAHAGDDVAMVNGRYQPTATPGPVAALQSVAMSKSSLSEPNHTIHPMWSRRESAESIHSVPGTSINPESDSGSTLSLRHRRRPKSRTEVRAASENDPMRGMDMLADSARRVSDAEHERKVSSGESEQSKSSPESGTGERGGTGGPKYTCLFCAKTFSRPSSLRIHTYSHTGERPFVCKEPTCRRSFSVQSNLKRHAKVHLPGGSGAPNHSNSHMAHQNRPLNQGRHPSGGRGSIIHQHPQIGLHHPSQAGPPYLHNGRSAPAHQEARYDYPPPLGGYGTYGNGYTAYPPSGSASRPGSSDRLPPQSEHMQAHYRQLQKRDEGGDEGSVGSGTVKRERVEMEEAEWSGGDEEEENEDELEEDD